MKFLTKIFAWFFGSLSWAPPAWLVASNACRRARPVKFWCSALVLLLLVAGSICGYRYYQTLPQPVALIAVIDAPGITWNDEDARPDDLVIEFAYDDGQLAEDPELLDGPPSVARIDLIGQTLESGISMRPAIAGKWLWEDDRTLVFTPVEEWPAGTEVQVEFDEAIFVAEAHFEELSYSFTTPDFTVEIDGAELYQDPKEKQIRRVVSTLSFSYPVDKESLEKNISLMMRPSGSGADVAEERIDFTLTYDKNQREAYIQSAPISLPEKTNYLRVAVAQGIKPATGGTATQEEPSRQVLIPDVFSFLKVTGATQIIRNEKQEPEQVLTLEFTDEIEKSELLKKLKVYLLPKYNQQDKSSYWSSPREVSAAVLRESQLVALEMVPNPNDSFKTYSFVFDVPENRYLYMHIEPGLRSINDFVKSTLYDEVALAPEYPRELNIMGEGSMLALAGSHQLSMLARGIDAYHMRIGRILPNQINHLVSQTAGDITDSYFDNYSFDEENIAEFGEELIYLKRIHPKEANYTSFDLTSYLPQQKNQFGLFFISVTGWDAQHSSPVYGVSDRRVILVTDLGLLVKDNADQSHEIFVQSISSGKPVGGAQVELLGRNGQPIFTRTTASDGRAVFPSTEGFGQEELPNAYVVKTGQDISFIPFQRSQRQLNYSQFAVGGVRSEQDRQDNLNAYLFSDRGLYRPGETVELGCIVKDRNLGNIAGIPLEIAIGTPRGSEISNTKLKLSEKGLFAHQFVSAATSETGTYQASVYLVRDNQWRGRMIGSTTFRVEEFQPDTLKIESQLQDVPQQGWTSGKSLQAQVKLENLFGTPAQKRKVTAQLTVTAAQFKFPQYSGFVFSDPYYDPAKRPLYVEESLSSQQTDENGIALFDIPLERFDRGTYQLEFQVEGFEPGGGRSVTATNRALLSPLSALLGYKSDGPLDYINKGSKRSIDLVAITPALEAVALDGLRVRLIEVQNISTLVKQNNGTYAYQSVKREETQAAEPFSIAASGQSYALPTETPGEYLLEILDGADLSLARIGFNVVGHGNLLGKLESNAELQLQLNQKDYRAGELIEMSIRAPYKGAGLITIESDRVHAYKWFQTQTNSALETIRIPQDLEGNAYVNVTFVRDAASKEIFTSPLSYAVAPFTIDRSKRSLDVQLEVAPLARPGKALKIGYRTSVATKLIVFAVDEGILQVADYATPRPLDHFLKKRALEVNTLQILDLILPEFDLVKQVSASGGGYAESEAMRALAENLNPFARAVDKPAVFWSGIIDGSSEPGSVEFAIPDTFAGNLRVMAVAVADEAIGVAQESTQVRGPFVITPSVLTQAAPGDRFRISAAVANVIEGSGPGLPVSLRVTTSEQLEVVGDAEKVLNIDENGEQLVEFDVRVNPLLGPAEIVFHASSGDEDIRRTAGLSIRPSVPYRTSLTSGYAAKGEVEVELERKLYAALSSQRASASDSPLVLIDGLAAYLDNFPHGCTEQIVSQVFPLVGLLGLPAYEAQATEVRQRIEVLVQKLRQRQQGNGGFSLWPGGRTAADFPSVYALHFLIEAQEQGLPVSGDLLSRGQDYLRDLAHQQVAGLEAARVRAYAIYLLARMGEVVTNDLVNLQTYLENEHKKTWRADLTAVYMAAAYALLQKDTAAEDLAGNYRLGAASWESYSTFNSPLTQDAQYLYLLSRHFSQLAADLDGESILRLLEPVFNDRYNTISSSYTILALGVYSQMLEQGAEAEIHFSAVAGSGEKRALDELAEAYPTVSIDNGAEAVAMQADRALFYLASQSGFDLDPPAEAVREGLEITREYYDDEGNRVERMEQGKELSVRLKVRALGRAVDNVAVVDLLPGGFEVLRDSVSRTGRGWRADYVDIREDRVLFYGSFDTSVRELSYRVKLTASGSFVVPPTYAESMYDRSVRAGGVAARFEVIPSE
jgi:uncharacterized protein YfaS (alpha-2-macroglobulin family)